MARRPAAGQCVHCLQRHDTLTWDHVFPKAWYPTTTPDDTEKWKVPSCDRCNKDHGKNEAELLVRFGLCVSPEQASNMGIVEKTLRALDPGAGRNARDAAVRASKRDHILSQSFRGADIPRQAIYPGFGPQPTQSEADQVAITISARGLKQLIEKVVRGFTYLEGGKLIEPTHAIENFVVNDAGASEFRAALDRFGTTYERPPGLRIRRAAIPEDRVSGIFEIEIWGQLKLYATVTPKKPETVAQLGAALSLGDEAKKPLVISESCHRWRGNVRLILIANDS